MTPEELGYLKDRKGYYRFDMPSLVMCLCVNYDKEQRKYIGHIEPFINFDSQKDIDNLQIAYNNLQRDLKELNNESNET